MRHLRKRHRLGRPHAHRKATLKALSVALIRNKRITTTVTKAKALRVFVEPILNRAKEDSVNNRRQAFRHLQDKESVKVLFSEIAEALGDRNGGYTRIVKLGARPGDAAERAVIELVDFNTSGTDGGKASRKRRTRRGTTKRGGEEKAQAAAPTAKAPKTTATPAAAAPAVAEPLVEPAEGKADVDLPGAEGAGIDAEGSVTAADEPLTEPAEGKDIPEAEAAEGDEETKA